MLNLNAPIAQRGYSSAIEDFNKQLIEHIFGLTEDLKPKEPLLYPYFELLLEAQSITRLALNILNLAESNLYLESLGLTRSLLERTLQFKVANNFDKQINFKLAVDLSVAEVLVKNHGSIYSIHQCRTTKSNSPEVCLEFRTYKDSPHNFPMARYHLIKGRGSLGHTFPTDYRQLLWSFVEDSKIREDQRWLALHFTKYDSVKQNLIDLGLLTQLDEAKLITHYGFLSAIAHAPDELVNELHGHNGRPNEYYGPSHRLINLYVGGLLILILETLTPWVVDYDFLSDENLRKGGYFLSKKELVLSELGFPFGPDHEFDSWRRSLPKLASVNSEGIRLDLSLEFLDPDFLTRIADINTMQNELLLGKTWVPMNLFV